MCTSTVASNAACGPSISRNLAVRWLANHVPQLSVPAASSKSAHKVGGVLQHGHDFGSMGVLT